MPDYLVCDERDIPDQKCDLDHIMEAFSAKNDREAFFLALREHPHLGFALFREDGTWVAQHIEGESSKDEAPMRHPA